jgi:RNA polymerase sigma factor (sigma-70 family)
MYGKMKEHLAQTLSEIREAGLYKEERLIESPQRAAIQVKGKEVLNFCANNYLGLSDHPRLIEASKRMMDRRGFGMSSVRFICGTQDIHKELEKAISELPPGFRTVFNMYVVEGYSHSEIAQQLGISETTSRSQLLRARALLQAKLKK